MILRRKAGVGVLGAVSIILKVLLCIIAVLILLLVILAFSTLTLRLGHSEKTEFKVRLLGISFNVTKFLSRKKKSKKAKTVKFTGENFGEFPEKPSEKKTKKKQRKGAGHKTGASSVPKEKKSVTEILELITDILTEIAEPLGKCAALRIKRLRITAASDSPDKTAVLFGNLNTAAGVLMLVSQKFSVLAVDDGAVGVYSDFLPGSPTLEVDIELSVKIKYVILAAFKGIKSYLKNK